MVAKIQFSDIKIERLSLNDSNIFQSFSCDNERLDTFFQEEIVPCIKHHYVVAYCVRHTQLGVLAIFTLSNDCITLTYDSEDFIEENINIFDENYQYMFKEQGTYPAINIAHLAVHRDYRRNGIGRCIIEYIIGTFINFDIAGCQFVTVDSINNSETNLFYMQMGFSNLTNSDCTASTRRMYLNLEGYR